MRRREALRTFAAGLALTGVRAATPDGLWAGARAIHERLRAEPNPPLLALTQDQADLVAAVAERIIPETDTPGARAARVHEFVDIMLAEWFDEDVRTAFLGDLERIDARAAGSFGTRYVDLAPMQQDAILAELEAEVEMLRARGAGGSVDDHVFQRMKWLTVYGYYTSEVGATQEIGHVTIPGRYEPCAPVRRQASGLWE